MESSQAHIAIIDDDISFREALTGLVSAFGFCVESFVSAKAFLECGFRRTFGCLIVDIQMPEMSGLEFQAKLSEAGERIPIIFVTSFPHEQIRAQALGAGAVGFLKKPCDRDDLLSHIHSALKQNP